MLEEAAGLTVQPSHVYLEESLVEFNGIYSHICIYEIPKEGRGPSASSKMLWLKLYTQKYGNSDHISTSSSLKT